MRIRDAAYFNLRQNSAFIAWKEKFSSSEEGYTGNFIFPVPYILTL